MSKGGFRHLDWIRSVLNRLYNSALEERKDTREKEEKSVTLYDQMRGLTQQRRNDPDGLGAIAVKAERGMLFRLERAFQAFFRRCKAGENPGYPRLRYKAEWAGREFVEVNPQYTSQDCHRFGARYRPGRSETYRCSACDLRMDRDHNAALNILRAGVLALGAETWASGPSVAPELCADVKSDI